MAASETQLRAPREFQIRIGNLGFFFFLSFGDSRVMEVILDPAPNTRIYIDQIKIFG